MTTAHTTSPLISFGLIALILGLLSALGPLATDMYLHALPGLEADLGVSTAAVQGTLIDYFAGFGLAQLLWGPLSDRIGRRPVILLCLALFAGATLACAAAPGIGSLIAARGLQAIGAAGLMVVRRAVVRDLYAGAEATRLMGIVMIVTAASPMLAPLAGSGVLLLAGWRSIFLLILALGVMTLVLCSLRLPETLR